MSIASLIVHPVLRMNERGGLGWTTSVEIATCAPDAVPFLKLTLSQPLYSVPPPLRVVPESERVAALGQAFALILLERVQRPALAPRPLSRCTVGDLEGEEVETRPR
jgi:hypothetical protein